MFNLFCVMIFGRHNYLDTMYKNIENIISNLDSVKNIVKNPEEIKKLGK